MSVFTKSIFLIAVTFFATLTVQAQSHEVHYLGHLLAASESEADRALKKEFESFESNDELAIHDLNLPETDNSIRILWWNIDCGTATQRLSGHRNYKSVLEKNILTLVNSAFRPDVLILGEYCPYYLDDNFESFLKSNYRYKHHLVRNIPQFRTSSGRINERNGIMVLSDYSLNIERESVLHGNEQQDSTDKRNRKYLLLSLKAHGEKIFLNPVHLFNPWRDYRNNHGLLATFFEIESGKNNANAIQGRQIVKNNLSYVEKEEKLLIVGDFNSPRSFYAVDGYVYKELSRNYVSLVDDLSDTYMGGGFMNTIIDHAFGQNLQALYSKVWPLKGSGHLPVYIVIE